MELECAFVAEPKPSHVRIVELGKSEDEGIIHELFGDAVKNVKINAGVGQFECLVENELGTSTTIIRLQPEGESAILWFFQKLKVIPSDFSFSEIDKQ